MNKMGPHPYCFRSFTPSAFVHCSSTEMMPFVPIGFFLFRRGSAAITSFHGQPIPSCIFWSWSGDPRSLPFSLRNLRFTVERRAQFASARPGPLIELRLVHAMLVCVVLAVGLQFAQNFFGGGA